MALGFRRPGFFRDPAIKLGSPPYSAATGALRNVWTKAPLGTGRYLTFGLWSQSENYPATNMYNDRCAVFPGWFGKAGVLRNFSVRKIANTTADSDLSLAIYTNESIDSLRPLDRVYSGRVQWRTSDADATTASLRPFIADPGTPDSVTITDGTVLWALVQPQLPDGGGGVSVTAMTAYGCANMIEETLWFGYWNGSFLQDPPRGAIKGYLSQAAYAHPLAVPSPLISDLFATSINTFPAIFFKMEAA